VDLAVAINGTIRATARSLDFSVSGRQRSWCAVVPESAFREGFNELQVFEIVSREDGTARLLPAYRNPEVVDHDNLIRVAAEWTLGVEQHGFYGEQWHRGQFYRWTDGDATLTAPVDPDRPPAFVQVSVYMPSINPDGTRMRITVNGCRLFTRTIAERSWRRKIPLDRCEVLGDTLTIGLESNTMAPQNPRDRRTLGVALSSVRLLDAEPET
jgi:hypothetical protein